MPAHDDALLAPARLQALADGYLAAWEAHDVAAILEHHTEDTVFTSVATGRHATGKAAVSAAFREVFAVWPDLTFETRRIYLTPQLIVVESAASGTQSAPLPIGDIVVQPNGRRVSFDVADIFPLRGGRFARKDTYLDAYAYIRAMREG